MPPRLMSAGGLASIRRALGIAFQHTYTRTVSAAGTEDAWGETDPTPGTATTGVVCIWEAAREVVTSDGGGTTRVMVPALTVTAADPLNVGDQVSAITGVDGVVLAAGPFKVERLLDATAGLGASVLRIFELKAAQVQN